LCSLHLYTSTITIAVIITHLVCVVAIEPIDKVILLDIRISSFERTMLVVAEQFLKGLVKKYGKHSISTDRATWYPQKACKFLKITHHIHSYYEKSIVVERTIQYLKDRTEYFLMIIFLAENITVN
jgi:putative transposase